MFIRFLWDLVGKNTYVSFDFKYKLKKTLYDSVIKIYEPKSIWCDGVVLWSFFFTLRLYKSTIYVKYIKKKFPKFEWVFFSVLYFKFIKKIKILSLNDPNYISISNLENKIQFNSHLCHKLYFRSENSKLCNHKVRSGFIFFFTQFCFSCCY